MDAEATRSTNDVDVALERSALGRLAASAPTYNFQYRHVAGPDMLLDVADPKARSAVHLIFVREKVRPADVEPIPPFSEPVRTVEGVLLAPVSDLVRMKLTSFRLKDQVHIQDLDRAGLITPEIEVSLSEVLRARLAQVRATE